MPIDTRGREHPPAWTLGGRNDRSNERTRVRPSTDKKRHTRNPIKHHGHRPTKNFGLLAEELIRDGKISSDAFRVYALLVSHKPGNEESAESIALRYGWGQAKTQRAMKRLQDERLLMVQHFVTAKGTRAYETYHVPRSRRFTAAEMTDLGKTVVLGSLKTDQGDDPNRVGGVTPKRIRGVTQNE